MQILNENICVKVAGLKATWLTVINKILKFPPRLDPVFQMKFLFQLEATRITKFKNDTFGQDSRLLERDMTSGYDISHMTNTNLKNP